VKSACYQTPMSLILYDIDQFKAINDRHGHPAGDKVLADLSGFVAQNIRNADVLARWGGEEFILMLPGCDGAMALAAAEKLRAAIDGLGFGEVGTVTCSFGVAQYADGDSAATLIARADSALYRAKVNGRDRVELAAPPDNASFASVA
jgi:diguanylate cyclase (GGDEF)-like protein